MNRRRTRIFLTAVLAALLLTASILVFFDFAADLYIQLGERAAASVLKSLLHSLLFSAVILLFCLIPFLLQRDRNRRLAEDLRSRAAHEADLLARSTLDDLTKLLNRSALALRVEEFLHSPCAGRGGVLLMLDLDNFKGINDSHGHSSGDQALLLTARILRQTFRATDMLARAGGDEFLVFMPGANVEQAELKGRQLCRALYERSQVETCVSFTCSIGVASFPADGATYQQLFLAADAAMYCAKRCGKGDVRRAPSP